MYSERDAAVNAIHHSARASKNKISEQIYRVLFLGGGGGSATVFVFNLSSFISILLIGRNAIVKNIAGIAPGRRLVESITFFRYDEW